MRVVLLLWRTPLLPRLSTEACGLNYSRVPNKRTCRLLENQKKIPPICTYSELYYYWFSAKSPTYTFVPTYIFKTFCQIEPMLAIFYMNFSRIWSDFQEYGFPRLTLIRNFNGEPKCWIIDGPLLNAAKNSHLCVYQFSRIFPTYTFIQSYISITFWENFPPILLFGLVVYSEL